MKETVKTLLSKVDDAPEVEWKELSGDEYKQLVYQEIWNDFYKKQKLEIADVVDKKNVLLYGLSTRKLNIGEGGVELSVLDPYDVMFDPLMKAWDIESARFVVQQNIFRSIREILADDRYTAAGKNDLKIWMSSPAGITASKENQEQFRLKMERLQQMGVTDKDFPYFAGGDRIVNLTEHYSKIWNTKTREFEKRVIVYAENTIELLNEKLSTLIGVDFWPFVMWCEDPETNDLYSDSVADLIRTPNKVINVWFSQLIENRTLKNFQMHWFLPGQNYTPQTYTPGPGVMIPSPPGDDVNKVIKPVEISGLDDTLLAIQEVIAIAEKGSGATALDKGVAPQGQQTLGEIQIMVGKASERAVSMTKFYRVAWYEVAKKWDALMQANPPKISKLYKLARSGKMYPKTVLKSDWKSTAGYEPMVRSTSEQEIDNTKSIQKFMFILGQFPNNPALHAIAQKRMLEIVDLTPEELKEVQDAEKQLAQQSLQPLQQTQPSVIQQAMQQTPQAPNASNPDEEALMKQLEMRVGQLG
jgi:hypothetical protein